MKQRYTQFQALKGIFFTLLCLLGIEWGYAKNEDTPNLSLENGNYDGWELYYAYFGPADFMDFNSPNIYTNSIYASSVPQETQWTLTGPDNHYKWQSRTGNGSYEVDGTFSITNSRSNDPNMPTCARALKQLPNDFNSAIVVGGTSSAEILYDYVNSDGWKRRAMAEKVVYRFTVTEKSTLLKLCYASVLSEPNTDAGAHFGDEHPGMCLNVVANDGGVSQILPCGEYCGDASSNDATLVALNRQTDGNCFTSASSNNITYKPWTTNIYDLREHIGQEVIIEGYVHDCLLELYVCSNCNRVHPNSSGITDYGNGNVVLNKCNYAGYGCRHTNVKVKKRVMAGGHIAYGYLTGETMELKIDVDNCPEQNRVKITVPEGFGDGHYSWKTSDGVTLLDEYGQPYTNNIAYVNRSEIQDVDYICTITGTNPDCSPISISTRIAKDPIVMDVVASNACFNNVTFTDHSHITEILQDGKMIEPDTIKRWTWTYDDNNGHSGTLADYTLSQLQANPDLKNPDGTFVWTDQNEGKYKMTLTVETANGCTKSHTIDFKVQPQPEMELSGALDICRDEKSQLQVTNFSDPNNKYVWKKCTTVSNGDCTDWDIVQDSASTNNSPYYEMTGDDAHEGKYKVEIIRNEELKEGNITIGTKQCKYEKEFNVTVKEKPSFNFTSYATDAKNRKYIDICKGTTTDIEIANTSPQSVGNVEFTWSNTEKGNRITVGPADTTRYTVVADCGCKSFDTIFVNVKPLPELQINGESAICVGQTTTLTANGLDQNEAGSYEWYSGNIQLGSTGDETINVKKDNSGYYVYTLKGTNSLSCTNSIQFQVTVRDNPNVTIPTPAEICEGQKVVINVYNADSCQWNGGPMKKIPTESSINEVPNRTEYDLKAYLYYSDVRCESNYKVPITINKAPEIKIDGNDAVCVGGQITLTASDTADYTGHPNESNHTPTSFKWPGKGENQHFFIQVTQAIVDAIDDAEGHGIGITGQNFTLTSVDVTHGNANIYTNAEGRAQNSWQGEQLSKELFALANAGDVLAINVSTAEAYQTARIYNLTPSSVWNGSAMVDPDGLAELAAQQFSGAGKVYFQLTEAILTAAQSGGLCIGGGNYTYTSVDLYYAPTSRSVTIGTTGYATFGYPFAVDLGGLSEGQDAYTVTVSGTTATLTSIKGKKIPANTGIILKGSGNVTIPLTTEATDEITGNELLVSDGTVTGDGSTIYVLANGDKGMGFYKLASGKKVLAGKAYLQISGGAASARPFLAIGNGDDNTTGIDNLTPALSKGEGIYYDLQGRRVAQPTKGLYIVNGRKVVIK